MPVSSNSVHNYTNISLQMIFSESSEVRYLQANSTNETVLFIMWESPANPNGDILSYFISITDLKYGTTVREGYTNHTNITASELGIVSCLVHVYMFRNPLS